MPGITVKSLDVAGGTQLNGTQDRFTVEGQPVVVVGDPIESHGDAPHNDAKMVTGSAWMTWNGLAVCRDGDKASCDHTTTGRPNFIIE